MTYLDLIGAQLIDPFRIVLLIGLLMTTRSTRAITGRTVPILAGSLFVAVLIPMTLSRDAPFWPQVATGLVANLLLIAIMVALFVVVQRARRPPH